MNKPVVLSLFKGEIAVPIALRPTMRQISARVAAGHGLTVADIIGPSRLKPVSRARQEAWYEIRRQTSLSMPQIAVYFGDRDHTTILAGVRAHVRRMFPEAL